MESDQEVWVQGDPHQPGEGRVPDPGGSAGLPSLACTVDHIPGAFAVESGFLGHVTQVEILVGGDGDEAQEEGAVSDPHPSAVAPGPLLSSHDLLTPELSAVPALPKSFLGHLWHERCPMLPWQTQTESGGC